MKSIHKILPTLLLLISLSISPLSAAEPTLNQQRESILYASLVAMGFSDSTAIVTDNEVVVDYVIRPLQSDVDLVLQLQSIFIAAAKVAPDTILTVIKGRYNVNHPPMIVVAVPNDMTSKLINEVIDPATFWQMVAVNDEALLDATERQERKGLENSAKALQYAPLNWQDRSLQISSREMISSLGTTTGLGETGLEIINKKHPELIKPLYDTLLAVKIADLLYQARDTEQLAALLPWPKLPTMDRLLTTVYPKSMRPWFEALTRYKVSLNLLPDGTMLDPFDGALIDSYSSEREDGYSSRQACQNLYKDDEFIREREQIYNILLASRGLNKGEVEKSLQLYLESKANSFIRNRLEATFQRQMFLSKHQDLTDYLWEKKQAELRSIKRALLN